jgi:hypothetical protein
MVDAWPELRVPAPRGPHASEHLGQILKAVRRDKPGKQGVIEKAISACLSGKCLQGGDSADEGVPPPPDDHGARVLFARSHAGELGWDACLAALRHGMAPPDSPKKAKRDRA